MQELIDQLISKLNRLRQSGIVAYKTDGSIITALEDQKKDDELMAYIEGLYKLKSFLEKVGGRK